jgi:hypothetical protein
LRNEFELDLSFSIIFNLIMFLNRSSFEKRSRSVRLHLGQSPKELLSWVTCRPKVGLFCAKSRIWYSAYFRLKTVIVRWQQVQYLRSKWSNRSVGCRFGDLLSTLQYPTEIASLLDHMIIVFYLIYNTMSFRYSSITYLLSCWQCLCVYDSLAWF